MNHLLKVTILVFCLTITSVYAQEEDIKKIFDNINQAIKAGDIEQVLEEVNPNNQPFRTTYKSTLENMVKLEDLEYQLSPKSIEVFNDTVVTTVLEQKYYSKFDRGFTEPEWKTIILVRVKNQWKIDHVSDREYLRSHFADISVTLNPDRQLLEARAEIDFEILEEGEDNLLFWLNRGLDLQKVVDEKGKVLPFTRKDMNVVIPWEDTLKKGQRIKLTFYYSGNLFSENKELGYRVTYIGKEGVFASFGAQWYPKIHGTRTKAKASLTYTVPKHLTVASVGKFLKKSIEDDSAIYKYRVTVPMDYTFNANTFTVYRNEFNGVQVNVFLLNGTPKKAEMYAQRSTDLVRYLTDLYGVFPADNYTISEVPAEITMGLKGMGGQGLNFYPTHTLRDDVFEFPLFAHEIGHIWWGGLIESDPVSGRIIDEGFAQLNAALCYRYFYGEKAMWDFVNKGGEIYPPSARSYFTQFYGNNDLPIGIYDEDHRQDIANISYLKPHFVLLMLMESIGYPSFIQGIKRIVSEYSNKRFALEDLKSIMEQESGQNLNLFFDQWFYKAGAPEFQMHYTVKETDKGRFRVEGKINQLRDTFQVQAEIQMANDKFSQVEKVQIKAKENTFSFLLNFKPNAVTFDPSRKILRWSQEVNALPLFDRGMAALFSGKSKEAIIKLKEYLHHNPFDPSGHVMLANAYLNEKQFDLAEKHLLFVTEEYEMYDRMSYDVPYAFALLGQLYNDQGDKKKAEASFNKVLNMVNIEGSHSMAHHYFAQNSK